MVYLLGYLAVVNIIAYFITAWDKRRAVKDAWRISEKTLFTWALVGGSIGVFLAMKQFRHKTKKWYFKWGVPLLIVLQVVLLLWLYNYLFNAI